MVRNQKLDRVMYTVILIDSSLVLTMILHGIITSEFIFNSAKTMIIVTASIFTVLAIAFFIVGIMSLHRLKKYFPQFYNENRWTLIIATLGLSLPLLFRGVTDSLRGLCQPVGDWMVTHEITTNILTVFFWDIIPIAFQLSSLIFGYIRRNSMKKQRRLEIRNPNQNQLFKSEYSDRSNESQGGIRESAVSSNNSTFFEPPLFQGGYTSTSNLATSFMRSNK